jgi:hypothetical protein
MDYIVIVEVWKLNGDEEDLVYLLEFDLHLEDLNDFVVLHGERMHVVVISYHSRADIFMLGL